MFFTGFLTGFAKQAQASIAERNKEIRESIDETLKEKAEEVEKDRILKKKLRNEMKERSAMFTTAMDTDMEGLQLTVGQQLAIIGDEKTYNQFIEDIANYRDVDSPKAKQAIVQSIKKRFGGKMNIDPNMSLDQAIEASTQLDEITMPTAVIEKTAFGIPSNIQQRAIERFKAKMPKELTGARTKTPTVGKYQGLADVQDVTQSESTKLVSTFFQNEVSKIFTEAPGTAGKQDMLLFEKGEAEQILKSLGTKETQDAYGVPNVQAIQSKMSSIFKGDPRFQKALEKIKNRTINKVIESYASKDGFIGPNLARSLQANLGLDIGNRVGRAKDKVFIGDFYTESESKEQKIDEEKESESVTKNITEQQDLSKNLDDITKKVDKENIPGGVQDTTSAQSQANNNLKSALTNIETLDPKDQIDAINNLAKDFNIEGSNPNEILNNALDMLEKGVVIPKKKDKPSIANTAPGTTPAPKQRIINNLVQRHKFSASNRKKAIEKELSEKHNMTIEDARKYVEEEKKAGRI